MATHELTLNEAREEPISNNEITYDDASEWPSSSPDKQALTGKALLESGLVGIWKDRTDIGDTLAYARKLRERANKRHHDPFIQSPDRE